MTVPPWLRDPTLICAAITITCTIVSIVVTYCLTRRRYEVRNGPVIKEDRGIIKIVNIIKGDTVYNIGDFKKEVVICKKEREDSD